MNRATNRVFETPQPVQLYVEIGRGLVVVDSGDSTETTVEVTGERSEDVLVEQQGDTISVLAPKLGTGFRREPSLNVTVTVPSGSDLAVRTGSAPITASGSFGDTRLKSGSGDIEVDSVESSAVIETGSGDVTIGRIREEARIRSGSGHVRITETLGGAAISVGSGDIEIDRTAGATAVKTGSGSLQVATADGDVALSTGSGDAEIQRLNRGKFSVKGASGDVAVGVPPGVPVWTDISTISGHVRSDLVGAGRPTEDQEFIELRLKTVSGNITLNQL